MSLPLKQKQCLGPGHVGSPGSNTSLTHTPGSKKLLSGASLARGSSCLFHCICPIQCPPMVRSLEIMPFIGHPPRGSLSVAPFLPQSQYIRVIDKRVRGRKIKRVTLSRHKLYWLKVCWLGSLGKYCFDWKWIIYVQFWTQNNFLKLYIVQFLNVAALKGKDIPFFFNYSMVDNVGFKFSVGMKEIFQNIIFFHEVRRP